MRVRVRFDAEDLFPELVHDHADDQDYSATIRLGHDDPELVRDFTAHLTVSECKQIAARWYRLAEQLEWRYQNPKAAS